MLKSSNFGCVRLKLMIKLKKENKEKDKYHIISFTRGIQKQEKKPHHTKLIDTENKSMVTRDVGTGWAKWVRESKDINYQ